MARKARTLAEYEARLVGWLRDRHPTKKHTNVVWLPIIPCEDAEDLPKRDRERGDFAQAYDDGDYYVIELSRKLVADRATLVDTLLHEWAHLIANGGRDDWKLRPHRRAWAVAYGHLYEDFHDRNGHLEVDYWGEEK